PDDDGDGYAACGVARPDCDDTDAAIHPGAREVCGDGVDQDCAGDAELDCSDAHAGNVTAGGDVWTVNNEAVAITFDRGTTSDGLTGPISLTSRRGSDAQLFMTSPQAFDRYAAVTRWQTVFSWRSDAAAPGFTELAVGDAVVQVRGTWADGAEAASVGSGTSTFTILPDGRIHRHDEVTVSMDSDDQYLTTYASFDRARVDHADWDGPAAPSAPVPLDLDSTTSYRDHYAGTTASYTCVFDSASGDRVLFAAQPQAGADGTRVTEVRRATGVVVAGLSFDWQRGGAVSAGDYAADTMLHVGHGAGARPCPDARAYVMAFRQPPAIAVAEPGSVTAGDADGYREASGSYEVSAGGGRELAVTMAAAVPSLALHVVDVPSGHDPVVSRGGATLVRGRDYHLQHGTDDLWLFVVGGVGTSGVRVEWP
ncbi:MAG: putative metal-binding motif-containing protein, partial [Deltaproteobacteria bacterium]|nr:putative metal-binding motif-containing protein [Kofleriaceae bacterium]